MARIVHDGFRLAKKSILNVMIPRRANQKYSEDWPTHTWSSINRSCYDHPWSSSYFPDDGSPVLLPGEEGWTVCCHQTSNIQHPTCHIWRLHHPKLMLPSHPIATSIEVPGNIGRVFLSAKQKLLSIAILITDKSRGWCIDYRLWIDK